jgi:hypothetical protein
MDKRDSEVAREIQEEEYARMATQRQREMQQRRQA